MSAGECECEPIYRHRRTGNLYVVLDDVRYKDLSLPEKEQWRPAVIYRAYHDEFAPKFVRSVEDFEESFEKVVIPPPPPTPATPSENT